MAKRKTTSIKLIDTLDITMDEGDLTLSQDLFQEIERGQDNDCPVDVIIHPNQFILDKTDEEIITFLKSTFDFLYETSHLYCFQGISEVNIDKTAKTISLLLSWTAKALF